MAQQPMSSIAHRPGKMSEEADYTLREMKAAMLEVESKLAKMVSREDLPSLEDTVSRKESIEIVNKLLQPSSTDLALQEAVTTLSSKVDAIKDAINALVQKLDAENVTNLDTDYEDSVSSLLV